MTGELVTSQPMVHPTAIVEEGASIGAGTRVWHRSHVRAGSRIGDGCTIGFSVYIDDGAVVGNRCKIQNHVSVYRGVTLEDDVFVGPSVTFTNDRYPRAGSPDWEIVPTVIHHGASLGANATIVCGIDVGTWAMAAAGSVVTSDVPAHGLVAGNPARLVGWVCACGRRLARLGDPIPPRCAHCRRDTPEVVVSP
jgi:acetyltransferase-like isoleucine patch superfamily enzyme